MCDQLPVFLARSHNPLSGTGRNIYGVIQADDLDHAAESSRVLACLGGEGEANLQACEDYVAARRHRPKPAANERRIGSSLMLVLTTIRFSGRSQMLDFDGDPLLPGAP